MKFFRPFHVFRLSPSSLFTPSRLRGFTLVELLVSISIFIILTALLVVKYGGFSNSIALTDAAYDLAIDINNARQYGISVKPDATGQFARGYGIFIDVTQPTKFNLYENNSADQNFTYYAPVVLNTYNLKQGVTFKSICAGADAATANCTPPSVIVEFERPNPEATIVWLKPTSCTTSCYLVQQVPYVKITLQGTNGDTKSVVVTSAGEISVEN